MILNQMNITTLPLHLRERAQTLLDQHPEAEHFYEHATESFTTRYNPPAPEESEVTKTEETDEGDEGEEQHEE